MFSWCAKGIVIKRNSDNMKEIAKNIFSRLYGGAAEFSQELTLIAIFMLLGAIIMLSGRGPCLLHPLIRV